MPLTKKQAEEQIEVFKRSADDAKEALSILKDNAGNLVQQCEAIVIPYEEAKAGYEYKEKLGNFARGLQKFCREAIGTLESSKYTKNFTFWM